MKRIVLVVAVFLVLGMGLNVPKNASALDANDLLTLTTCNARAKVSFTGVLTVAPGDYDIYAQLAKRGQKATVTSYAEPVDHASSCKKIGQAAVNGDRWTKVGNWSSTSSETPTIFQISSDALGTSLDANRPSLMLISRENPPCTPKARCETKIGDQTGYILPAGTFNDQDSLHVARVTDPSTDKVKKVVYYVDDEQVSSSKTVEPFDTRYASFYFQKLATVIEYESGQRVIIETKLPGDFNDSPMNFVFRLAKENPVGLVIWSILIVGLVLTTISYGVYQARTRRHQLRILHGLEQARVIKPRRQILGPRAKVILRQALAVVGVSAGILAVVVLVNTFIVTLFRVDGHSMESTFYTDNQVLVNKIPVTLAGIGGREITPDRGDVVIMRAVYGVVDPVAADLQKEFIIKRVIGLPKDRVVVKDGVITIYNPAHSKGFQPDKGSSWEKTMHPNDRGENVDITLGNNELFVSGDNRPESVDSRFNGPITTRQIVGIVGSKLW